MGDEGMRKKPRVAIGIMEIAGYGYNLMRGLREKGIDCDLITTTPHPFLYSDDVLRNGLMDLLNATSKKRGAMKRSLISFPAALFFKGPLFLWSLCKYDVFIFLYDRSFFLTLDLAILKMLRKKVIVVCMGSDIRPAYMDGLFIQNIGPKSVRNTHIRSMIQFLSIRVSELFADAIISSPTISQFQRREYIEWLSMGIPMSPPEAKKEPRKTTDSIRILHSPSNPVVKGSDRIEEIIGRMIQKGYPIVFVTVKNRPHSEVIEELKKADLVIDQMYSDSPMATFVAEAAMYGVPALVGGYFAENGTANAQIPTIVCTPDKMEETLEGLLKDREGLKAKGEEASAFIDQNWRSSSVAERYLAIINGDLASVKMRDPAEDFYVKGSGATIGSISKAYAVVLSEYGPKGLLLGDRDDLVEAIRELARTVESE